MKKLFGLAALLMLVCAMCACNAKGNNADNTSEEVAAQSAVAAEDASGFIGSWEHGRLTLSIIPTEDTYKCTISWPTSSTETTEWVYNCSFEEGALVGTGSKKTTVNGGSTETAYEDGEVKFELTLNGMLLWEDAKENAGDGLAFEKKTAAE